VAGETSIDNLICRAADLNGELVAFAQRPRFARRLDAMVVDAARGHGCLDEGAAVLTTDHFALQHRFSDGRTVVERFVAERRPRLSADDREMVLGWREVVEGRFEVRRFEGDAVELHNLFDDVVTRLLQHGTRGVRRGAEADVRRRPDCAGPPGARRLAGQRALHREEFVQARGLGQPQRGHQPAHDTRFGLSNAGRIG